MNVSDDPKAKRATVGNYTVVISPKMKYGYVEHVSAGEYGGLWFDSTRSLVDTDGYLSYGTPKDVVKAIRKCGFRVGKDFIF